MRTRGLAPLLAASLVEPTDVVVVAASGTSGAGRKAADALLKLGYSQLELKRYAQARASLNAVKERYPDSEAARLAAERLQRVPAGAR